jgi:hypothetical protein
MCSSTLCQVLKNKELSGWAFQKGDVKTELDMQEIYWEKHIRAVGRGTNRPYGYIQCNSTMIRETTNLETLYKVIEVAIFKEKVERGL